MRDDHGTLSDAAWSRILDCAPGCTCRGTDGLTDTPPAVIGEGIVMHRTMVTRTGRVERLRGEHRDQVTAEEYAAMLDAARLAS